MDTSTKGTQHKGCNCAMCRMGRNHYDRNLNERRLRRMTKRELLDFLFGRKDDVHIHPISTPYTD